MPGKGVRDVPAEAFIKAYAAHLKSNDNVRLQHRLLIRFPSMVPIFGHGSALLAC